MDRVKIWGAWSFFCPYSEDTEPGLDAHRLNNHSLQSLTDTLAQTGEDPRPPMNGTAVTSQGPVYHIGFSFSL